MMAHSPAATRYGWPAVLWSVTTNAPFPRGTRQPALVVTPVPGALEAQGGVGCDLFLILAALAARMQLRAVSGALHVSGVALRVAENFTGYR